VAALFPFQGKSNSEWRITVRFAEVLESGIGTNRTCRGGLTMSVHWVDRKWLAGDQCDAMDPQRT
jgi:hypothetical protein